MESCHEKFLESYNNYPSQDNEGYVPNRGGFKAGFYEAYRLQQEKINIAAEDLLKYLQETDKQLNQLGYIKRDSYFHKGIKFILNDLIKNEKN